MSKHPTPFAEAYPNLAKWIAVQGWIEVGNDGMSPSLLRVLDEGGLIFEQEGDEKSVDDALRVADAAIAKWMREEMGM